MGEVRRTVEPDLILSSSIPIAKSQYDELQEKLYFETTGYFASHGQQQSGEEQSTIATSTISVPKYFEEREEVKSDHGASVPESEAADSPGDGLCSKNRV